jgi:hypothetical protein
MISAGPLLVRLQFSNDRFGAPDIRVSSADMEAVVPLKVSANATTDIEVLLIDTLFTGATSGS